MSIYSTDPVLFWPTDLSFHTLSYLDAQDLAKCCRVSKIWQKIASSNFLWKELFPQIPISQESTIKSFIDTVAIGSEAQLVHRIQEFAGKMRLNQSGHFTCVFPYNTTCTIRAEIEVSNTFKLQKDHQLKAVAIFMKKLASNGKKNHLYGNGVTEISNPTPLTLGSIGRHFYVRPQYDRSYSVNTYLELPHKEGRDNYNLFKQIETIIVSRKDELMNENTGCCIC